MERALVLGLLVLVSVAGQLILLLSLIVKLAPLPQSIRIRYGNALLWVYWLAPSRLTRDLIAMEDKSAVDDHRSVARACFLALILFVVALHANRLQYLERLDAMRAVDCFR